MQELQNVHEDRLSGHFMTSGKAEIDNTLCTGCGVCEQLCKFDALHAPKED